MTSIVVKDLSWSTPNGRSVISGLSLSLGRERIGLVGRNGVGKSTLLHILIGDRAPTSGSFSINGSVRMLQQSVEPHPGHVIADLFDVREQLAVLARADAGTASMEELGDADWTLEDRIRDALARVDLVASPTTPLSALSGGQVTRAGLAAAIFARPDLLLLDEPTNNLDREGRLAVASLVREWSTGLILVSHDRALLEHVDAIVEMSSLGASRYGGNWSSYRARKAIELEAAEHDLAHARNRQDEIARKVQLAVERKQRRDAAGSRKAARGDMPRILLGARKNAAEASGGGSQRLNERHSAAAADEVVAARARVEVLQQLSIVLPTTGLPPHRRVLDMTGVVVGYDPAHPLVRSLPLRIVGPERVALVGPNGAGKSTILRTIAGDLAPLEGLVVSDATFALVDQHVSFLDRSLTILENFRLLNPGADENACRSALAGFLFRADAALQQVATLSGGQMLRAGLACRLAGAAPPELLVLDEPANHLDLDSIQAIEDALRAFDGALLVVSHDATFLANIGVDRQIPVGDQPEGADETSTVNPAMRR